MIFPMFTCKEKTGLTWSFWELLKILAVSWPESQDLKSANLVRNGLPSETTKSLTDKRDYNLIKGVAFVTTKQQKESYLYDRSIPKQHRYSEKG